MSVLTLSILQNLSDSSRLSCSVSLDYSDTFTNFETLFNLETSDFYCKRLLLFSHKGNQTIVDMSNHPLKVLELAFDNLDSFSNGDLKLRIIPDSLEESFVVEDIPLVLVTVVKLLVNLL